MSPFECAVTWALCALGVIAFAVGAHYLTLIAEPAELITLAVAAVMSSFAIGWTFGDSLRKPGGE